MLPYHTTLGVESSYRFFVYYAFDVDGCLIYIGRTRDASRRFKRHRTQTSWWPQVDYVILTECESERLMVEREAHEIQFWQPIHNRTPWMLRDGWKPA